MIAIAVDDETAILKSLVKAISASPDIDDVTAFSVCSKTLEWVADNTVDVAFLDINMRGMNGLVLAEKILELQPDCRIIFCTGYSDYAVDAFKIHVSGYLMKPVTAESVQKELDHIKKQKAKERLLTIKCFGNFEAYANREPLVFRRPKAKELLAYLIDRKGAGVTTKEICAVLWDDSTDDKKNRNYLYQLINDLRSALKEVSAESILIKNGTSYAVDADRLDCDYFSYLEKGKPEFHGEYMSQYSWAETTCGFLSVNL